MTIPSPLFKYMTADRAIQVLKNKTIRFTQPSCFNDPFEVCPSLDMQKIKSDYLNLPKSKQEIQTGIERKALMKGLQMFTYGIVHRFAREYESMGILSLSERCDIPLMWSHYAENHKGIVIGFRPINFIKPSLNHNNILTYCDLNPVTYQSQKFKFPSDVEHQLGYMWTKDNCWKYEREWRVIRGLGILEKINDSIYVSSFHPEAVRSIIFGIHTPKDIISEVHEILKSEDYKHVHTYATLQNSDDFELDVTTARSRAMMDEDILQETYYVNPDMIHVEKLVSRGELYRAMEIIEQNTVFGYEKDSFDYNP